MTRSIQMRRFYALQRRLSGEMDMATRWRIARLLCQLEARIARLHGGRTLAWITYRDPARVAALPDIGGVVYTVYVETAQGVEKAA